MIPYDPRRPYPRPQPPPFRRPVPQPTPKNRSLERFRYFPDKKGAEDIFKFVPKDEYGDAFFYYYDVSDGSFV